MTNIQDFEIEIFQKSATDFKIFVVSYIPFVTGDYVLSVGLNSVKESISEFKLRVLYPPPKIDPKASSIIMGTALSVIGVRFFFSPVST